MSNLVSGNTWYVDTSSTTTDTTSFRVGRGLLVGFIYTMNASTDVIEIYDLGSDSASVGTKRFTIKSATAANTTQLRLADMPIIFNTGCWVKLTGSPTATFVIVLQGN